MANRKYRVTARESHQGIVTEFVFVYEAKDVEDHIVPLKRAKNALGALKSDRKYQNVLVPESIVRIEEISES
jgi:hypothetical protein